MMLENKGLMQKLCFGTSGFSLGPQFPWLISFRWIFAVNHNIANLSPSGVFIVNYLN